MDPADGAVGLDGAEKYAITNTDALPGQQFQFNARPRMRDSQWDVSTNGYFLRHSSMGVHHQPRTLITAPATSATLATGLIGFHIQNNEYSTVPSSFIFGRTWRIPSIMTSIPDDSNTSIHFCAPSVIFNVQDDSFYLIFQCITLL